MGRRQGITGLATALAVLAGLGTSAAASAAVINFDDRLPGDIVNLQYSGQGVTFNNLKVLDFPAGLARSGPNWVEQCYFEHCTSPAAADFTAGQDSVRVWVGASWKPPAPVTVELKALDGGAGSNVIDTDAVVIPASPAAHVPITHELLVDPPGDPIKRVEIAYQGVDQGSSGIAIDDFEFSNVGPPPPCNATTTPTVRLFTPADSNVQNNAFRLSGFVSGSGDQIIDARITAVNGTPLSGQMYTSLIGPAGGNFGPVSYHELLRPGANEITVSASNCLGTATSNPITVNFNPIPATTQFQQLGMVELTQGIQMQQNNVTTVAANANSSKRTFARVYLKLEGGAAQIDNVTGRLVASRPDGSLPGGPVGVESLNSVTVKAGSTLEQVRSNGAFATATAAAIPNDLTSSLNFELPEEWLGAGRLHVQLDRLNIEGAQTQLPCVDCDNDFLGNNTPAYKTFYEVPPVRVWLVTVPYRQNATSPTFMPTQNDVDMLSSWLRRAYPTAEVIVTQSQMATQNELPEIPDDPDTPVNEFREGFTCRDINSRLSTFISSMPAEPAKTRYYGIVDDGNGFMRGCSSGIPSRFASGPSGGTVGNAAFGWDTDGSYNDWYGGHELAHTYGRKHPGQCTESDDDGSYPFPPDGLIGTFGVGNDFQGFDAGNATLGLPMRLYDWRDGWTDVTTYCKFQWISAYTHRGILRDLCSGEPQNCPNNAGLPSSAVAARGGVIAAAKKAGGTQLAVNGIVDLKNDRTRLESVTAIKGLVATERPKKSKYAIELRSGGGRLLKSYAFDPKEFTDQPAGEREAMIDEVVKFIKGTQRIEIVFGRDTLAARNVSANAPEVELTKPKKGAKLKDSAKVKWAGSDADGGRLSYTLLYADDGKNYEPVAAALRKRSYKVDLSLLGGGKKAAFKVVANDGVLTGSGRATKLAVPAKEPRVAIEAPGDGTKAEEGQSIQFFADVYDLQDPRFDPDRIVWSSSIEGELGRGPSLTKGLVAGTHEITVTATNSAGVSASKKVTVEVEAAAPAVDAVLIGP